MRPWLALCLLAACPPAAPTIDVTAPEVVSVDPADGGTAVPLGTSPELCFSEAMDPTSLTPASVALDRKVGSKKQNAGATPTLDATGRCLTLTPPGPLAPSSSYEIALTTGAHSAAGVELSHGKSATTAFASTFFTAGVPTEAALWIPSNGTLAAPLDLAEVLVGFSRPMARSDAPLQLVPAGGGSYFVDGLHAAELTPAPLMVGESFSLTLSASLVDADGDAPVSPGSLGFTVGSCAEGDPPSVTDGTVLPRDRDALLVYQVDRPCLCAATIDDSGCADAGFVASPATCSVPYDPCQGGALCSCAVPLVGLCPGTAAAATPLTLGWNGLQGSAPDVSEFQLASPLPPLVITEVMLSPSSSRTTGAFVEVANLGDDPIDLLGLQLANCAGTQACAYPKAIQAFGPLVPGASTVVAPHDYALLVDGQFEASQYPSLPADVLLLAPMDGAPLLSLSTTEPQPIGLLPASGAGPPLSTFDGTVAAQKGFSAERIDPAAPDPQPGNWSLTAIPGGTPGLCNSVTPAAACPEAAAE
ncbi:MAG TPA: Ig-like domain-containing protein [Myxococcales bacterium]|nr:Ig-like domain-containing protein [Myxococcales bacterium]